MNTGEQFWNWFEGNRQRYYEIGENYDKELYQLLQTKLSEVQPFLSFQIGGTIGSPIRILTITANGNLELFSKVEEIVTLAPKFKNWEIRAFKPADGFQIKVNVGGVVFDPKKLRFTPLEILQYPDMGAIRIYMPEYVNEKDELFRIGVNALLEACLGEKIAALQINYFDITNYPESPEEYQMSEDFTKLKKFIEYRENMKKYN